MAMNTTMMIASVLSGLNILLLAALVSVWVRNYLTFRTSLSLGLVAFSAFLLFENAFAIYFFFRTSMLYSGDPFTQQAILILRLLQLCALAFLTYVTMQ